MSHAHHDSMSSLFPGFRLTLSLSSLLLVVLLSACSLGGSSTGAVSTTTSGSTSTTTRPTSVPAQNTSVPSVKLTSYTGDGFTIGYPAGWTVEKASPSAASVFFINPAFTIEFIVTVSPNPNANSATSVALDPLLQSMQSKPHYQHVTLAPTTTVGGATWDQIGAIGDLPHSGRQTSTKVIAMAINRPDHDASTKMYKIEFSAPTTAFDQTDSAAFQPMLQSFQFI